MQDANVDVVDGGYVKFVNLFKLSDLEQALLPYKNTVRHDEVIRYYFACVGLLDSPRLLQPLALFKRALAEFDGQRVRREVEKAPARVRTARRHPIFQKSAPGSPILSRVWVTALN